MLIYFVRHGQTDHNAQGIIQGHMDVPLNEKGRAEARVLADAVAHVPFVEAHSSSLSRARETAEIVLAAHDGLELQIHPGLMERSLGSLEGQRWVRGHGVPPDAEASADFRARVAAWFRAFLASHAPGEHSGGEGKSAHTTPIPDRVVLVVSHGAYLSALLAVLLGREFAFSRAPGVDTGATCFNTCITRVRVRHDAAGGVDAWSGTVESYAESGHLAPETMGRRLGVADDVRRDFVRDARGE
ncbi:hypothetical protein Q8F55_004963 [Vanrija albida]|uniref:Phosphoglycerate mutase n=1 Tax=Vanrija albida TaxID=181172 RepID=A0ABR3Q0A8_9TREE